MYSFKSPLAILFAGIFIQSALSADAGNSAKALEGLPELFFDIEESSSNNHKVLKWGFEFPITGAVNPKKNNSAKDDSKKSDQWSLALGRGYVREKTLHETLQKNGLESLLNPLKAKMAEMGLVDAIKEDNIKPEFWQVMYIGQKNDQGKFVIEGIGFIQGNMNIINPQQQPIYYISTHHDNSVPAFLKEPHDKELKLPGNFIKIDVSAAIKDRVNHYASTHYPRFLCMQGVKKCFAGHAGLIHFAWNAQLNPETGTIPQANLYYGFTLTGHHAAQAALAAHTGNAGSAAADSATHADHHGGAAAAASSTNHASGHHANAAKPHAAAAGTHSGAAAASVAHSPHGTKASTEHGHNHFKIDTNTGSLTALPLNDAFYEEVKKKLTSLLEGAVIS